MLPDYIEPLQKFTAPKKQTLHTPVPKWTTFGQFQPFASPRSGRLILRKRTTCASLQFSEFRPIKRGCHDVPFTEGFLEFHAQFRRAPGTGYSECTLCETLHVVVPV